jgi:hypothetical protein
MNKNIIGILFIISGLAYGSLLSETVYTKTLGWLVENGWISPPVQNKTNKEILGRTPTIILYSLALISIGIYILWNRNL